MAKIKVTLTLEDSQAPMVAGILHSAARMREGFAAERMETGELVTYVSLMDEARLLRSFALAVATTKPGESGAAS